MKKRKEEGADSTVRQGQQFEARVAAAYRRLGYHVEPDSLVSGQQIDLIATRRESGFGVRRLAIECKAYATRKVGNEDAQRFAESVSHLIRAGKVNGGVLVSLSGATREAKAVADDETSIELLTLRELEDQFGETAGALAELLRDYDRTAISERFVPLGGRAVAVPPDRSSDIPDIVGHVLAWARSSTPGLLPIIGDWGAGKTTVLARVNYELAKQYVGGLSEQRPLLVLLRDFRRFNSLSGLLADALRRTYRQEVPLETFWRQYRDGLVVVLLDGFDEMGLGRDSREREALFDVLTPLMFGTGKLVITSRPTYFASPHEIASLLRRAHTSRVSVNTNSQLVADEIVKHPELAPRGQRENKQALRKRMVEDMSAAIFRSSAGVPDEPSNPVAVLPIIEIAPLSHQEICCILKKQDVRFRELHGVGWDEVRRFFESVYDLSDLMKRPLLLDMMIATVLAGRIDVRAESDDFGPATLYSLYTEHNYFRESEKGRLLTREQRRMFCQALALAMISSPERGVTPPEIIRVVEAAPDSFPTLESALRNVDPAAFASDVRTCSFLSVSADNVFRFSHKSFGEFFIAQYLVQHLVAGQVAAPLTSALGWETLQFVGSHGLMNPDLLSLMQRQLDIFSDDRSTVGQVVRSNLLVAALSAEKRVPRLRARSARIDRVALKNRSLHSPKLSGIEFAECALSSFDLSGGELSNWQLAQTRWNDSDVKSTNGAIELIDSRIERVRFEACHVSVAGERSELSDCQFTGGEIGLRHKGIVTASSFSSCSQVLLAGPEIRGCQFANCGSGTAQDFSVISSCDLRFNELTIVGGEISDSTIVAGQARIEHCRLVNTSLKVRFGTSETLSKVDLQQCTVSFQPRLEARLADAENCTFTRCTLQGLLVSADQFETLRAKVRDDRRVRGCNGFVVPLPKSNEVAELLDRAPHGLILLDTNPVLIGITLEGMRQLGTTLSSGAAVPTLAARLSSVEHTHRDAAEKAISNILVSAHLWLREPAA